VTLVREGLATVDEYSADRLSASKDLKAAEEEAKVARRNVRIMVVLYSVSNA
jgi:endonuclease YncB( thermonuclease family)